MLFTGAGKPRPGIKPGAAVVVVPPWI